MNLSEVQKKIEFLKGRNEYNTNNKYANDLTDRFLQLLGQREKSKGDPWTTICFIA